MSIELSTNAHERVSRPLLASKTRVRMGLGPRLLSRVNENRNIHFYWGHYIKKKKQNRGLLSIPSHMLRSEGRGFCLPHQPKDSTDGHQEDSLLSCHSPAMENCLPHEARMTLLLTHFHKLVKAELFLRDFMQ